MAVIGDRLAMLAGMTPRLAAQDFVFVSLDPNAVGHDLLARATGFFREPEGVSLILAVDTAIELGLNTTVTMRRITLEVYSSLEGVGLTAAVAHALADADIACNMVAAFHHDHVFVPSADAAKALDILLSLQKRAQAEDNQSTTLRATQE